MALTPLVTFTNPFWVLPLWNLLMSAPSRPTETLTSKAIQGATRSKGGGAEDPIDGDGSSTVVHANYSFQRKFVPIGEQAKKEMATHLALTTIPEIGLLVWSRRPQEYTSDYVLTPLAVAGFFMFICISNWYCSLGTN
ncbi:hypothetical protein ARMSODRAFT_974446 [Armillaria solidipes]|uniref:Uncharacterized protein n=1 Tax=Armillaria solidipes TaxID=1076256 RepID=A0A2H3BI38_9AGAR|nr:hypothetical protein ARMSODRAFT_974446 [Armillaria solidipes]